MRFLHALFLRFSSSFGRHKIRQAVQTMTSSGLHSRTALLGLMYTERKQDLLRRKYTQTVNLICRHGNTSQYTPLCVEIGVRLAAERASFLFSALSFIPATTDGDKLDEPRRFLQTDSSSGWTLITISREPI